MRRQSGFSYVVVMFLLAVLAVTSARALENQLTAERREKEAELIRIGLLYRQAIQAYYEGSLGSARSYPAKLEDLLDDPRPLRKRRPLRRLYRDPITGGAWGLIREGGGTDTPIIGVFSLSTRRPMKTAGFPPELAGFEQAASYQQWRFIFQPTPGS